MRVTFTNNVYPYAKGDTVDLTKDQKAEVDAYIKKWKIADAYEVEGGSKSNTPKSNQGSSASTKDKATDKGSNTPKGGSDSGDGKKPANSKGQNKGNEKGDETDPAVDLPEDDGKGAGMDGNES